MASIYDNFLEYLKTCGGCSGPLETVDCRFKLACSVAEKLAIKGKVSNSDELRDYGSYKERRNLGEQVRHMCLQHTTRAWNSAHVKGYEFLKSAMRYIHNHPQAIYRITTELYVEVAKEHGTMPNRVERGIRHAISLIRADDATVYKVLGRTGHLANGEFMATLNESIAIELAMGQE